MKLFAIIPALALLSLTSKCNQKKMTAGVYKARLETKALCMNYTFRLLEGKLDSSMVSASWTNETTGKSYKNAFGNANPCHFPPSVNEGDEFYFTIDSSTKKDCAVCMAYYPTPPRKIYINVVPKP